MPTAVQNNGPQLILGWIATGCAGGLGTVQYCGWFGKSVFVAMYAMPSILARRNTMQGRAFGPKA